jgi:hypothetical protein
MIRYGSKKKKEFGSRTHDMITYREEAEPESLKYKIPFVIRRDKQYNFH